VATADQDEPVDAYEGLYVKSTELEKAWRRAEEAYAKASATIGKENPSAKRTEPLISKEKSAFKDFIEAREFYVDKQAELTLDDLVRMHKGGANMDAVPADAAAEVAKAEVDLNDLKATLAKVPVDDPVYNEAREQIRNNIKLAEDHLKTAQESQSDYGAAEKARQAAALWIEQKKKTVQLQLTYIESQKPAMKNGYNDQSQTWISKCAKLTEIKDH
jgi:hypothetical protein